ncbi:MAG TPA: hypothetical protein VE685_21410 [Thermoanaerobaculia bacterium]|nr:hypothetical protein [Thermoanaerobaculia bacterium]
MRSERSASEIDRSSSTPKHPNLRDESFQALETDLDRCIRARVTDSVSNSGGSAYRQRPGIRDLVRQNDPGIVQGHQVDLSSGSEAGIIT